ncbi:MAG: ABC transporter transmembrane domain-containing protein [Lachnospiraceae bacterium]|jgi:hypothetical protein|nr:hypothetical protein [Lachnospiraceae bacterium]MCH4030029.1 hypothetical protein [Lachnospiraceae bacterium]MCH4070311.1 hypothetical protein [Lachnospiraceae bacterium]MCH4107823.1 hypothetical protein [Lachnospiraceae bacterium]MCI1361480.1 ABC transporter transmembrane domain-containing protein [Lachnospiraceae bacterium]
MAENRQAELRPGKGQSSREENSLSFGTILRTIQTYSFSNIDKYSTAGLITHLTTDVTNMQNAYQMIIRIAIRPPLMLIMSLVMAILISPSLSAVYLVAVLALSAILLFLMLRASGIFNQVFTKYDDLNESVKAGRRRDAHDRKPYIASLLHCEHHDFPDALLDGHRHDLHVLFRLPPHQRSAERDAGPQKSGQTRHRSRGRHSH